MDKSYIYIELFIGFLCFFDSFFAFHGDYVRARICTYAIYLYICAQNNISTNNTMKKIFVIACAVLLSFASCTKDLENRVGALENDVESIQKQLTELSEKKDEEIKNRLILKIKHDNLKYS